MQRADMHLLWGVFSEWVHFISCHLGVSVHFMQCGFQCDAVANNDSSWLVCMGCP